MRETGVKVVIFLATVIFFSCSGVRPFCVAEGHGKLAPCPKTSNCIFSNSQNKLHKVTPFTYTGTKDKAMQTLVDIIRTMDNSEIISRMEYYLYAEFTSSLWQIVDDVEFDFNEDEKLINFRSASRVGKSDRGINRKRMEEIRILFKTQMEITKKNAK